MAIDFFLVPNTLTEKKGFIAQTVHSPTLGFDALIEDMSRANAGVSGPEIRGVISLLEERVMSALLDGRSVEVGGMLKLTPMVSGVLPGEDLRVAGNNPRVRIVCRVQKEFERRFSTRARLEKRRATDRSPTIDSLREMNGERSGLHASFPNEIKGFHLKLPGLVLASVSLAPRPTGRERAVVPAADLGVHRYSAGRLLFNFSSRFTPPDWLASGREIYFRLEYRREKDGRTVQSNQLETVWRGPHGV
jgi:hypothetical protein